MTLASSPTSSPSEYWVIDSCSVLWVKERVPRGRQPRVYKSLTGLVSAQGMLFPKQVHQELGNHTPSKLTADLPLQWTMDNRDVASRRQPDLTVVREVLGVAPRLLDVNKPKAADEADPYVAALALELQREGHTVTVITEDRKDTPRKLSLTTACGLLRLVVLPMEAFLEQQGIYTVP